MYEYFLSEKNLHVVCFQLIFSASVVHMSMIMVRRSNFGHALPFTHVAK